MAFDILKLLGPEKAAILRRRMEADRTELARLHALPDRWLAEAVLGMARDLRRRVPGLSDPTRKTYDDFLVWQAVPLLARRMGCSLLPNEATDPDVLLQDDVGLRVWVAQGYEWFSKERVRLAYDGEPGPNPSLLLHEAANGNPVAILLDRAVPPRPDSQDHFARTVREISARRGFEAREAWWPGMQHEPVPAPEDDVDEVLGSGTGPR